MLLSIQKRDVSSYQTFRQALIQNNQGHVVDRFLQPKPGSLKTQPEKKGKAFCQPNLQKIGQCGLKVIELHLNSKYTYIQDIDICIDYFSNITFSNWSNQQVFKV